MDVPTDPGIYYDLPFDVYLQIPAVSKSQLSLLSYAPYMVQYYREHPEERKDTAAMRFGSLVDELLFGRPDETFYVMPDGIRRDRRTKKYQAQLELAQGRTIVSASEWEAAADCVAQIVEVAGDILERSQYQVSIVWRDPDTGLLCKGRPDILDLEAMTIWDLKLTSDPRPGPFSRIALRLRYHWQAAMYLDGWETLTGDSLEWGWIACRMDPPHLVQEYLADSKVIALGRRQYKQALAQWAKCEADGQWPLHNREILRLSFPEWAFEDEDKAEWLSYFE